MPKQVIRLLIAFTIFIGLFLVARAFLTPASFGKYGHYRGDAIEEIASKEIKYVNKETCVKCHKDKVDSLAEYEHKLINCQTCHGPGYKHNKWHEDNPGTLMTQNGAANAGATDSSVAKSGMESPEEFKMVTSDLSQFCLKCHAVNAARPEKTIKQIDVTDHYDVKKKCMKCHSPHAPSA